MCFTCIHLYQLENSHALVVDTVTGHGFLLPRIAYKVACMFIPAMNMYIPNFMFLPVCTCCEHICSYLHEQCPTGLHVGDYEGLDPRLSQRCSSCLQNPAAMKQLVEAENADVVCLQETKMQDKAIEQMEALVGLPGWHCAWNCSTAKKGYSGTAIISK